ncbi:MAG: hypothetical protein HZA64_04785 [Rhodocyclales bacterium]|nr:hypothetical protein [Rhodocyclales bacterium]
MRLWLAGGISVLLHGALIALPPGRISFTDIQVRTSPQSVPRYRGGPAPLTVALGPQSVRLASAPRKPGGLTGAVMAAAPALDATATLVPAQADYKGSDEAFGLPAPVPFGLPSPQEYLSNRELSEHAAMLTEIPGLPDDPAEVPGAGILVITLWINELGQVDRTSVVSSQLDTKTERAVVAQFRHMRFSPGRHDGQAVKSRMKIRVEVLPPKAETTGASAAEN